LARIQPFEAAPPLLSQPDEERDLKSIEDIVGKFVEDLTVIINKRACDSALAEIGNSVPPGRRASAVPAKPAGAAKPRRKGPVQLCPVPGCKNRAAPVFGMVCSKHKDLPKAVIKKHRDVRKNKNKKASKK
jgi:hypothetical protein